jgi:prepilin-type N-terminal cleavage/methylation domain-containing protein
MTPRTRHPGFTLLELLVVLVILTILTLVAVHTVDGLQDQTRYDATQRTLGEVEEAVLGPGAVRQPDGSLLITGFVADMGRLPSVPGGAPVGTELSELWLRGGLAAFSFQTADVDGAVRIGTGWRGPYLRLPLGATELRDGWGNFHVLTTETSGSLTLVREVSSLGANNAPDAVPPAAPYDGDLAVGFANDRFQGAISVNVFDTDADGKLVPITTGVRLRCFVPDGNGGVEIRAAAAGEVFGGVPVGLRVVRAYKAASDADITGSTVRTTPVSVVVPPAGTATVNLVFPYVP